jgi:glycosyltransferase 2 family protein
MSVPLSGPIPPHPPRADSDRPGGPRHAATRIVQAVFVAAVAAVIVLFLARSWSQVSQFDWQLRPLPLVGSAVCFVVYYALGALLWWLILRTFGLPGTLVQAAAVWGKSILARYLPGTVFMFAGRLWMSVRQGLAPEPVSAAMIYEQVLVVGGALTTAAVLFPFWKYERTVTAWSLLGVPLVLVGLHPRVFAPVAGWGLRLLHRPPLERVMSFGNVCLLLVYTVAVWLVGGLGCWLTAAAVTHVGAADLPVITVAFALAFVAGMVAFLVPSGIGVREGVLAAATAGALAGGAVALAWALLLRLWLTLIELAFVAVVSVVEWRVRRRSAAERDDHAVHAQEESP